MNAVDVAEFSESYFLLPDCEFRPYLGDKTAANTALFNTLNQLTRRPLIKTTASHQWLYVDPALPDDTIAVPWEIETARSDSVFLTKDSTAHFLLQQDVVEPPDGV